MKQASDAMREALKGDSAASAEMSDALQQAGMSNAEPQAEVEMVLSSKDVQHLCKLSCTVFPSCVHSITHATCSMLQVPPPVSAEHRQQLEDMGFSANK